MKRYIYVSKSDREFISKAFDVSDRMVMMALSYDRNGGKAERIRQLALKRGGIEMMDVPVGETFHDSDGVMRQYLPGDVVLEFSKVGGWCDVIVRGGRR